MLDLFHDSVWLIPVSIFFGGIVGSPHCMSMCGPIVWNFANRKIQLFAYQMGRMISYTFVGALVGAFGKSLLGTDRPVWLSNLSLLLIALLLFINGYRAISGKTLHFPMPPILDQLSVRIWRYLKISRLPQNMTAGLAGIFTVFLPCGHLYSFLIGAVATGSALRGAVFMFAFWLGSAPLLSFGGVWLQKILRPKLENGQRWAGILLVVAGLFSILSFVARSDNFVQQTQKMKLSAVEENHPLQCH